MKIDSFWHGNFWTGDPQKPQARTLAVQRGRIVAVDDVDGLTANREYDLGDDLVIPGLHDAHHHTTAVGEQLAMIDLRYPNVTTLDGLYEAIRERASQLPGDAWVKAAGYDQNRLGGHPTAEGLDQAGGGRPVLVEHVSHHMVAASTRAFEMAGYPRRENFPDIDGGRVIRDEHGLPAGLLQENAGGPIRLAAAKVSKEESLEHLRLASEQSVAYGLTSLTEPGIVIGGALGINAPILDAYQTAVESGVLKPRMTIMPFHHVLHELDLNSEGLQTLDMGVRTGFGDDRLRLGPVKIISDGSLIGRSAAVHDCFCAEPDNRGVMVVDPADLSALVPAYDRAGWSVAIHAIGDRAIDHSLDAIERARRDNVSTRRHRIEHFAIATQEQVDRAARLEVVPVPQGVFISEFGDGILESLGAQRAAGTYRMRSLLDAGITVPGSTDAPVSDANPFVCLRDLIIRKTSSGADFGAQERVAVSEAVSAYTHGSAYAVGQERERGTLERGKLADFVRLSDDIFQVASDRIGDIEATATVIGGALAFNTDDVTTR